MRSPPPGKGHMCNTASPDGWTGTALTDSPRVVQQKPRSSWEMWVGEAAVPAEEVQGLHGDSSSKREVTETVSPRGDQ